MDNSLGNNRSVKYLFISHDGSISGAPMVLYRLFTYARKKSEHNRSFLVFRYSGPLYEKGCKEISDDEVLAIRAELSPESSLITKAYRKLFDAVNLMKLLIKLSPTVIFCNTSINTTPILLARLLSIHVIVIIHEVPGAVKNPWGLRGFLIRQADLVVPVSSSSASLAVELGVSKHKIHVIHNGLDISQFNQAEMPFRKDFSEPIRLGFLAQWSQNKRFDLAVRTVGEVAKLCPDYEVSLVVGGEGYLGVPEEIKLILTEMKELENLTIKFIGGLTEVKYFYSQIDGLLITSNKESYPTVAMEAIAFGIPVFSFGDLISVKEVVSSDLMKSTPRNPSALASLICRTFTADTYAMDMYKWREKALRRLRYFSVERQWTQFINLMHVSWGEK